mgnify:CR=1 FL=1
MDLIYRDALGAVCLHGRHRESPSAVSSPHSAFGRGGAGVIERRNVLLADLPTLYPRLGNRVRHASTFRALGMACWNLLGYSDVASLVPYNPIAEVFSDDGRTIRAPWGERIFGSGALARVLDLLQSDPGSFRGVVPVFGPMDVGVESRDVPCLIALILSREPGAVRVSVSFRALNAFSVFPYDFALISVLAEACRAHLGEARAVLDIFAHSLHLDAGQLPVAQAALDEYGHVPQPIPWQFRDGPMDLALAELADLEAQTRDLVGESGGADAIVALGRKVGGKGSTWASQLVGRMISEYLAEQSVKAGASGFPDHNEVARVADDWYAEWFVATAVGNRS